MKDMPEREGQWMRVILEGIAEGARSGEPRFIIRYPGTSYYNTTIVDLDSPLTVSSESIEKPDS